ncbi:hypothetical protein [Acinetobacter colistiniresistens]|uniref:hypothetical protein n=1 Tax=Acinetobacter colistiniresistens TaxID=280145 RepID=UPI0012500532|nr:hypothetical protein [Acinetobacter colistiniresistens]
MSYVTTQLDDESGIQYHGVEDKTNINQIGNMANMLMLVEDVPRGRLDGSMTITKANKTAYLGQEKDNLYLQAVDDALDQNVPSIQVLRVSGSSGCEAVGFEGNTNVPSLPNVQLFIDYKINNGSKQRFTYTPFPDSPENVNYVYFVLNELLNQLENEYIKMGKLVVGGGGGVGYFQKLSYGTLIGASLEEVEQPEPVNLTLYAVEGQANDPISVIFGRAEVHAHSCGIKNWPGY